MIRAVSCVSFLNALAYVEGFRRLPESRRPLLHLDPPWRCTERLLAGEADLALLPSIEFARFPGAVDAGGYGIASRREVRSVILLTGRPISEIGTVAVDSNSRTSVALLQVILARWFGVRPFVTPMPADASAMLRHSDAALLIGDAALKRGSAPAETHDLAALWHARTRLPFVFALWAVKEKSLAIEAGELLAEVLAEGSLSLRAAAAREGERVGIGGDEALNYLTENIHYRVGPDEWKSLEMFFGLCRQEGILRKESS